MQILEDFMFLLNMQLSLVHGLSSVARQGNPPILSFPTPPVTEKRSDSNDAGNTIQPQLLYPSAARHKFLSTQAIFLA